MSKEVVKNAYVDIERTIRWAYAEVDKEGSSNFSILFVHDEKGGSLIKVTMHDID